MLETVQLDQHWITHPGPLHTSHAFNPTLIQNILLSFLDSPHCTFAPAFSLPEFFLPQSLTSV